MLSTNVPANIAVPWANGAGSGYIDTIPVPSQISITPGKASFTDGFPPLCFVAPSLGGVPPFGEDFNGILNWITNWIRYQQAGWIPGYNATFSAAIGGYPEGSIIRNAGGTGFWISTVENNTSDPDTGGAGWGVLTPATYPWSSITGAPAFVTAATAPVTSVDGMTGAVSTSVGLSVNSIGYRVLIVTFGGPSIPTEGTTSTLSGRPGTWMACGGMLAAADSWELYTRVS